MASGPAPGSLKSVCPSERSLETEIVAKEEIKRENESENPVGLETWGEITHLRSPRNRVVNWGRSVSCCVTRA